LVDAPGVITRTTWALGQVLQRRATVAGGHTRWRGRAPLGPPWIGSPGAPNYQPHWPAGPPETAGCGCGLSSLPPAPLMASHLWAFSTDRAAITARSGRLSKGWSPTRDFQMGLWPCGSERRVQVDGCGGAAAGQSRGAKPDGSVGGLYWRAGGKANPRRSRDPQNPSAHG